MDVTIPVAALNRLLACMLVALVLAGLGAELYRSQVRSEGERTGLPGQPMTVSGEVVSVAPAERSIVVAASLGKGGLTTEMSFQVPDSAAVTIRGASASLGSLEEGARVTVRYTARDGEMEAQEVSTSEGDEAEAEEETDAELEDEPLVSRTPLLIKWFSLSEEKNFPTWWSSLLLFACSATLAAITFVKKSAGAPYRPHWAGLSAIFLYMSLDEFVEIHEHLNNLGPLKESHGLLYFSWVIPAGILVLVFAASYVKFLLHLPRPTRIKVAAAGAIYVGGALVVELILGQWADTYGEDNLGYYLIDIVEESMEMLGATLFLSTLFAYLGTLAAEYRVKIIGGRSQ